MRTILRYGDSNIRGIDPETGERFPEDVRWPGVLRTRLGDDYTVIEDGLSGRTTVWDDPIEGVHKNGRTYLRPCLESHSPVDLIALMLGTNDLKKRFGSSASDIAQGAAELAEMFNGASEKSKRCSEHYGRFAEQYRCEYFDASTVIGSSDVD